MTAPGSRKSSSPSPVDFGRRCVLVVDDDLDTLRPTMRLLELNGYAVRGASGVQDALDSWTSQGCDILVADIALPDGSGLDLMRRLGASGVRGVAISGHDGPEYRRASLAAGFSAHLTKPVQFNDLLKAIADVS
jgi:CheY-like chemotaxis protein